MRITNSMTGKKEEFIPIEEGKVKMYACGITAYDLSHIGHARQAIVYEMMTNYLRYKGYDVTYVRNYTDIDDKIINKANELGKNALEFSKEQIIETENDMNALHVKNADITVKASEYIGKIISFIEKLIEKGNAYVANNGDVYFSVRTFKEYGKLSHRSIDDMINGVRIEVGEEKKDPIDFALWKSAKEGEIFWDSPWGKGRPGWHIECSAMILDTLGENIDIHGGGRDLLFPHHENEIAQSEALTGKKFVNYWTHCGLLKINGEKMSKSLGNSLTIRDALANYNYEVIKYVILSKHYASDMDIIDYDYKLAEKQMYYFYNTIKLMKQFIKNNKIADNTKILENEIVNSIIEKFEDAMDDDFNTISAIANLHTIFKFANGLMKDNKGNDISEFANTLNRILTDVKKVYSILGLFEQEPEEFITDIKQRYLLKLNINIDYIESQIEKRANSKLKKNFQEADKIREELDEKGIILNDTKYGTTWDIKVLFQI